MKVDLTVNGNQITADIEDRMLLVHFLRDVAGLTATNIGCDTTSCGACTVLLDGESVKSCTVLAAQVDERLGGGQPQLHQRQQRMPSGQVLRVLAVLGRQPEGLVDRRGPYVGKRWWNHLPASAAASAALTMLW